MESLKGGQMEKEKKNMGKLSCRVAYAVRPVPCTHAYSVGKS